MVNRLTLRNICISAVVAALYAGLCLLLQPLSYGAIQIRIAEAMTLLPAVLPETIPGLALGCLLANLISGNIYDIIFGTLATLLSAILTEKIPGKLWVKALPPVIMNALIIGLVLTYGYGIRFFWINVLTVGAGEMISCFALGIPLLQTLQKSRLLEKLK